MRIVSVNLNQRLGNAVTRAQVELWLNTRPPELFLSQEPFRPASAARPDLAGYRLRARTALISCWARDDVAGVEVEAVDERWQKILLPALTIHNVYFPADSARQRREMLQQIEKELLSDAPHAAIVLGDFNLAPRPSDGVFGTAASTFTTVGERRALAGLLASCSMLDATCPADGVPVEFTFERISQGKRCNFRCDLALISEALRNFVTVVYDHSVRRAGGFTDHSAMIVEIEGRPGHRSAHTRQHEETCGPAAKPRRDVDPDTEVIAGASHKTAIPRSKPSQIARRLLAQGVPEELGITSILDFGCAYGVDVDFYRDNGFEAHGYDIEPRFGRTNLGTELYDLVTVVYVVNVLPTADDRLAAVRGAAQKVKPGGYILLAARSASAIAKAAERGKWRPFNDGWISSQQKRTFQKGIQQAELACLLRAVGIEPCPCHLQCSSEVAWMLGKKSWSE